LGEAEWTQEPAASVERILRSLIFDFFSHKADGLDPSYDAIACAAGCSGQSAKRATVHLRDLKTLDWER